MRTIHNYKLSLESWESQRDAGRYNPATVITYRDRHGIHNHVIGAGNSDQITVVRDGEHTIVLAANDSLGYCGIEVFDGSSMVFDQFLQGDEATEPLDLCPINIIKYLLQWWN